MYSLEAKIRTETAKVARANGVIPAVVYGKDTPSTMVAIGVSDFVRLYRSAGTNHIVELNVDKKKYSTLIHEVQRHPVSGAFLHLDFLTVNMKEKIDVQIPIKLVGVSPAVVAGGQLHQSLDTLHVKCLPGDMIEAFELDVSTIEHVGQSLHVSDLKVDDKKFEVLTHSEVSIVGAHNVKEHKEEETPATPATEVPTTAQKNEEAA